MDNALMIGLTRQMTLRREMDVLANNIANSSTSGFKAERVLLETEPGTRARHQDGPRRLAYVDEWGMGRDMSQGALEETGRPLDFALDGEGFFTVETDGGERFTRDGRFTLNPEGELVAGDGARVLDEAGQPIRLDPEAGPVTAGGDGTLAQDGQVVARLGVVRFEAPGLLEKTGDNRFLAPDDAERAQVEETIVRQGMTERSNVQTVTELTTMLEVSRAYGSVTRMLQQTDELSRKAIERLGRP